MQSVGVHDEGQEDVQPLPLDEDGLKVSSLSKPSQGCDGALLHELVGGMHGVHCLLQHLPLQLVL